MVESGNYNLEPQLCYKDVHDIFLYDVPGGPDDWLPLRGDLGRGREGSLPLPCSRGDVPERGQLYRQSICNSFK